MSSVLDCEVCEWLAGRDLQEPDLSIRFMQERSIEKDQQKRVEEAFKRAFGVLNRSFIKRHINTHKEWKQLPTLAEAHRYALNILQQHCESEGLDFQIVYEIHKLRNDPDFSIQNYPIISKKFPNIAQGLLKCEVEEALIGSNDRLRKALRLFASVEEACGEYPESILQFNDVRTLIEFCQNRETIRRVFEGDSDKKLVVLASRLQMLSPLFRLDPTNARLMSPAQMEIFNNREEYISKGAQLLQNYYAELFLGERRQEHMNFDEIVQSSCELDEDGKTAQFKTDGHRYGQLIIQELDCPAVLFSGGTESLLETLRRMSQEDVKLFAMLQEAICQNMEKPTTEHWISAQLKEDFGDEKVFDLVPLTWDKRCLGIEQKSADEFKISYEYECTALNFQTGSKDAYIMQVTFSIQKDPRGVWRVEQPSIRRALHEAETLIPIYQPRQEVEDIARKASSLQTPASELEV